MVLALVVGNDKVETKCLFDDYCIKKDFLDKNRVTINALGGFMDPLFFFFHGWWALVKGTGKGVDVHFLKILGNAGTRTNERNDNTLWPPLSVSSLNDTQRYGRAAGSTKSAMEDRFVRRHGHHRHGLEVFSVRAQQVRGQWA